MNKRPADSCFAAECANCGTNDWLASDWLCSHCVRIAAVRAERGLEEMARYLAAHAAFEQWCAERGVAA